MAAAAAAAVGARRRLEGGERDAAAALSVALALWLAHALVDYDWDFVAVTGPALFAAGALAAAGRPPRASARPLAALAAVALAVSAGVSIVTPWLAERSVRDVGVELDRGNVAAAEGSARRDAIPRLRSPITERRSVSSPSTRRPATSSASTNSIEATAARRTCT